MEKIISVHHYLFIMPENKKDFVPSMNPEEMPTLQDYMSKDRESRMTRRNTKTCKNCGKVFTNTEELAAHYKKDHPASL
jgi:hypothetical protein